MAVLGGNRVGVIGECRSTFVGCNHKVRVVGIVPDNLYRRGHLAFNEIIGNVKQAAQKILVAGHAFLQIRVTVSGGWCGFQHESAFGTNRYDDRVFNHLRFDQAQHLGAEIFRSIRPAQAATRNLAAT